MWFYLLALVWNLIEKSLGKRRKRAFKPRITYRRISSLAIFRKHAPKVLRILYNQNSESVILWNRILVYATLYGQAKVSDVLNRYNIHLSNPSLDASSLILQHHLIILNNVSRLESYVSTSDTVSNFSINSNSGSGGLGGDGFSEGRGEVEA